MKNINKKIPLLHEMLESKEKEKKQEEEDALKKKNDLKIMSYKKFTRPSDLPRITELLRNENPLNSF